LFRSGCTLRFIPGVLENMPFGLLFDGTNTSTRARALRTEFLRHVPTLAIEDLNLMRMNLPQEYLMAESDPLGSAAVTFPALAFENGKATTDGIAFAASIQAELDRAGSTLTPNNVIMRSEELSCAGCHGFNGAVNFGGSVKLVIGFQGVQMISEDIPADGEAGPSTRYGVDPIVEKQFVPHRMQILTDFLHNGTPPVHSQ